MTAHTKVSGVWKDVLAIHTKVSGVWKLGLAGYVRVAGVWKQFYTSLTIDYPPISQVTSGPASSGLVTRGAGVPTIVNGSGTYTFLWTQLTGTGVSISNAAVQSPVFSATVANGDTNISTWRVTCNDTVTGASATSDEGVALTWLDNR